MMNLIIDGTREHNECDTLATKITPWQKHFAWKPVYICGEKYWLQTVYRRPSEIKWPRGLLEDTTEEFIQRHTWEYGTLFDVLKDV